MSTFSLPDLGEGLQEAEIVAWHVEVGDSVVTDQPLVSVETDKAVVEVPAPQDGRVQILHGEPGETIKVGAPLVDFENGAKREDSGVIVGEISKEEKKITEDEVGGTKTAVSIKAAPAVRALARKLDVDLAIVDPSGPNGAVTAEDVQRAARVLSELEPPEPIKGVRRAMARKMAQSHAEISPATVMDEVDIDAWPEGTDITIRVIRAICAACAAEPSLNAWYDAGEESRRLLKKIDLGIAAHTEEGLFVPILRDVASRDDADLRAGLEAMKHDVRAHTVPQEELRGPTITLSNFGVFGAGRFAEMVIVPPQVAIVGTGRIDQRVVVVDGAPAVRRIMPLSLTFDHRVVNGGEAAGFLATLIQELHKPA